MGCNNSKLDKSIKKNDDNNNDDNDTNDKIIKLIEDIDEILHTYELQDEEAHNIIENLIEIELLTNLNVKYELLTKLKQRIHSKNDNKNDNNNDSKEINEITNNEIVAIHYINLYGLDEHDIFDIEQSIAFAKNVWSKIIIVKEDMNVSNEQILKLFSNLELNYNDDDIGALNNLSLNNNNKLTMNLFIDWYIKHLYKDFEPISTINDSNSSTGNISIISDDSIGISLMSNN
jgi:hypothetical protein